MATRKKTGLRKAAAGGSGFVDVQDVAILFIRLLLLLGFDRSLILNALKQVGNPKRPRSIKVMRGNLEYWASLLTRWTIDTRFVDDEGRPKDLEFSSSDGSFTELVETVLPGEDPALCLEILLGTGAAIRLPSRKIRYRNRSVITNADLQIPVFVDEYLRPLISLLMILESGLNKRVTGVAAEAFQRSVVGYELSAKDMPELRAFVERHGMAFIEAIDEWLSQRTRERAEGGRGSMNLVRPYVGLYMTADEPEFSRRDKAKKKRTAK